MHCNLASLLCVRSSVTGDMGGRATWVRKVRQHRRMVTIGGLLYGWTEALETSCVGCTCPSFGIFRIDVPSSVKCVCWITATSGVIGQAQPEAALGPMYNKFLTCAASLLARLHVVCVRVLSALRSVWGWGCSDLRLEQVCAQLTSKSTCNIQDVEYLSSALIIQNSSS